MRKNVLTDRDASLIHVIAQWHAVLRVNSNGGHGLAATSERPAAVKFPDRAGRYNLAIDELGWRPQNLPFKVAHRVFNNIPQSVWVARRTAANDPPLWTIKLSDHVRKLINGLTDDYSRLATGYGNVASNKILQSNLRCSVSKGNKHA